MLGDSTKPGISSTGLHAVKQCELRAEFYVVMGSFLPLRHSIKVVILWMGFFWPRAWSAQAFVSARAAVYRSFLHPGATLSRADMKSDSLDIQYHLPSNKL